MADLPTPQPMDHDLEEWLAGYVLGALSSAETMKVEQYLQSHPEHLPQVRQMQEVMGAIAYSTREPAPASLRAKILSIPDDSSSVPSAWPPSLLQKPARMPWRKIGGAIAALVVLALGADNMLLRQRLAALTHHGSPSPIAEEHEEDYVFDLKGTHSVIATAKVIIDADEGEVIIGTQHLPPLPENEAYRLWAFTSDQKKILCGQFNTNAEGQTVSHFSVDPNAYTGRIRFLRISREPIANAASGQRVLVMTSES